MLLISFGACTKIALLSLISGLEIADASRFSLPLFVEQVTTKRGYPETTNGQPKNTPNGQEIKNEKKLAEISEPESTRTIPFEIEIDL